LISFVNILSEFATLTIIEKIRQFVAPGDPEYAEAGQTYPHFEHTASLS